MLGGDVPLESLPSCLMVYSSVQVAAVRLLSFFGVSGFSSEAFSIVSSSTRFETLNLNVSNSSWIGHHDMFFFSAS